uniref:AXH domain-containing protein n=1 Tax=Oryzias latipes TaxID=8090 RepID=A0A3P9LRW6_ORYLA
MMVWKVVTPAMPSSEPKYHAMQDVQLRDEHMGMTTDKDQSHDPLRCDEHFPSSPGLPTSDSYMEYDDLPDLQEVREEPAAPPVFKVDVGVSHQERPSSHPPETLWLTQLAHIATGPQSPLLQEPPGGSSSSACIPSTSSDLHSYARPPPALQSGTTSPSRAHGRERRRSRTSSECSSAVSAWSSLSDDEDMGWSFSWPPTAWHCFLKGSRLRFHSGVNVEWQDVEDLESAERQRTDEELSDFLKSYGSEGLQLMEHAETVLSGQTVLQLTFDPGVFGHTPVTVRCPLDHPFYIKSKGWSSFYPSLTVVHHGIPCYEMEVGDTCLPPGHRDAKHTGESMVFDTFKSYDFTPLDSSAVYVLSSMARRRRASQSSGGAASPDGGATHDVHSNRRSRSSPPKPAKNQPVRAHGGCNPPPTKCKRPMNAFMLFAKRFRVEYTQMFPGKDNRCVGVLPGLSGRGSQLTCVCVAEPSASSSARGGRRCEARSAAPSRSRPRRWRRSRRGSTRTAGNANGPTL